MSINARWQIILSTESRLGGPNQLIEARYRNYSLKEVQQIVKELKAKGITPPVEKTIPATTWLLLYAFNMFDEDYGSKDFILVNVEVKDKYHKQEQT